MAKNLRCRKGVWVGNDARRDPIGIARNVNDEYRSGEGGGEGEKSYAFFRIIYVY